MAMRATPKPNKNDKIRYDYKKQISDTIQNSTQRQNTVTIQQRALFAARLEDEISTIQSRSNKSRRNKKVTGVDDITTRNKIIDQAINRSIRTNSKDRLEIPEAGKFLATREFSESFILKNSDQPKESTSLRSNKSYKASNKNNNERENSNGQRKRNSWDATSSRKQDRNQNLDYKKKFEKPPKNNQDQNREILKQATKNLNLDPENQRRDMNNWEVIQSSEAVRGRYWCCIVIVLIVVVVLVVLGVLIYMILFRVQTNPCVNGKFRFCAQ